MELKFLSGADGTLGMKRIDSASGVIVTNRCYHLALMQDC